MGALQGRVLIDPAAPYFFRARITACAAGISNPTLMDSSSASIAAAHATLPSAPCSASPPATPPSPTKC